MKSCNGTDGIGLTSSQAGVNGYIFREFCKPVLHTDSLKLTIVGVFTSRKLTNTTIRALGGAEGPFVK